MPSLRTFVVVLTATVAIAATACTIGETRYETVTLPAELKTEVRTCDSPIVTPDLSTLKACGNGQGHCFDKNKVPLPDTELDPCPDPSQLCVPDTFLKSGGKAFQKCTFVLGAPQPGACMSTLVKDVKANLAALKQDVCTDPNTRCVPCISPLDGSSTHACDDKIGVYQDDCTGGTAANNIKKCCHAMGECTDLSSIPTAMQSNMERETCPSGKVCAPTAMIQNKPVKCELPLGFSGVCLDLCFASMFQATTQITRSSCGPTEVCMPCVLGKSEGMPGCD